MSTKPTDTEEQRMTLIVNGEKIEKTEIQQETERLRPRYEEVFADKDAKERESQLLEWSQENVVERVMALTDGFGADVVLECAGLPQAQIEAVECTKKSGRIALIGHHKDPVPLDTKTIVLSNLTLAGSRGEGERSVARSLALLSRQTIDLSPLITHTFTLDEIHPAFETAEKRLQGAIKVVVKP